MDPSLGGNWARLQQQPSVFEIASQKRAADLTNQSRVLDREMRKEQVHEAQRKNRTADEVQRAQKVLEIGLSVLGEPDNVRGGRLHTASVDFKKRGMEEEAVALARMAAMDEGSLNVTLQKAGANIEGRTGRNPYKMLMERPAAEKPPAGVQEYEYYRRQALSSGEQPMSFKDWELKGREASASKVTVDIGDEGPQLGTIPQGWQVTKGKDGKYSMSVVPGGPAEKDLEAAEIARIKKADQGKYISAIVSEDVDRSIEMVQNNPFFTTGWIGGQVLANLGGTEARNLEAMLETIRANTGFQNLQMLRDASPTGGALGPVSDTENKLLQAAFGSVEQSVEAEQLIFNLNRLKTVFNLVVHGSPESPYVSAIAAEREAQVQAQPSVQEGSVIVNPNTGVRLRMEGGQWVEIQ